MTRNWLLAALIFSVALNLGVLGAWAYFTLPRPSQPPPPPGPKGWASPGLAPLLHELNLEPEQKALVEQYFQGRRQEMLTLRQRLGQTRLELLNLLRAESPDEAALAAKIQEIAALQGQLELHLAQGLVAALKILRPEQKRFLLERLQQRLCCPPEHRRRWGRPQWQK